MLRITQTLIDDMIEHAFRDHPIECCGMLVGPVGSGRPERHIPLPNAAASPTFFEFSSADVLRVYREMDARDEEPVVIYHSHTSSVAYPSRTDRAYASEPDAHYVIVSTRHGRAGPEVRAFLIRGDEVEEEPIEITEP